MNTCTIVNEIKCNHKRSVTNQSSLLQHHENFATLHNPGHFCFLFVIFVIKGQNSKYICIICIENADCFMQYGGKRHLAFHNFPKKTIRNPHSKYFLFLHYMCFRVHVRADKQYSKTLTHYRLHGLIGQILTCRARDTLMNESAFHFLNNATIFNCYSQLHNLYCIIVVL